MDALGDLSKKLESIVDTLKAKSEELSFDEVSALVGDLLQQVQGEVDAWEKIEAS
ncbi:hypothetical protein KI387_032747, partial [Taxus chinensis]